jgi:hypothetical protein
MQIQNSHAAPPGPVEMRLKRRVVDDVAFRNLKAATVAKFQVAPTQNDREISK